MEENIKLEENNLEETKLEEKKEETKKGNKKFKKSAIAIALAALITVCGSLIKTSPHEIEGSLTDFVNNNKETTLFDDILDLDEEVGVKNIETGDIEKKQVEDAIKELEEKISVDEKIDNLKIKKGVYNELSDEAKKSTIEFFNENGIDTMIELYNDKENNKIEKARIAQQLLYVQEYNSESLKENGTVKVRKLYKLNFVENSFQDKTAGIDVLKGFMFADIDINNPLTGSASETKNKEFIKIVKDVFVSIGDAFLLFGTGVTNKNNKSQYISACNIYLADTLGISIDETSLFYQPYEKSIDIESSNNNLVHGNNNESLTISNVNTKSVSPDLLDKSDIHCKKEPDNKKEARIPLSSTFGPWEIL